MEWTTGIPLSRSTPRSGGRWAAITALLAVLALAAGAGMWVIRPAAPGQASPLNVAPANHGSLSGLRSLPLGAQAVISRTLAAGDRAFQIRPEPGDPAVRTVTAAGLHARVTNRSLNVTAGATHLELTTPATAEYAAGPLGIEQGFTVRHPSATGQLAVALTVSGNVAADLSHGTVTFTRAGRPVLHYGGLSATDAAHHPLRSWFTLEHRRLVIHVATRGARFPIHIDPFLQTAELSGSATNSGFGDSVAANGSTIVVGAPGVTAGGDTYAGAVYVFNKPTGGWSSSMTGTQLTEPTPGTKDYFGISVAIAGSIIVVGANGANSKAGAAYVYTEPVGGWSTAPAAPAVLTASDGVSGDGFGFVVATDGTTVAVGASHTISGIAQPVVYAFTSSGGPWMTQSGSTELSTGATQTGLVGEAVLVSGSTIFASAYNDSSQGHTPDGLASSAGAVFVFQNPPANEPDSTPSATISDPNSGAPDAFGWSMALSGSELAVGAPFGTSSGAVYVWGEPTGGWTAPLAAPATLSDPNGAVGDKLGTGVAIDTSTQPETVVAAASEAAVNGTAYQGRLDVFTEPTGGWTGTVTPSQQITAPDGAEYDQLGSRVGPTEGLLTGGALAVSAGTVVAGSAGHSSETGATYIYTASTASTTSTPGTTTTTPGTTTTAPPTTTTTATTPAPAATLSALKATTTGVTDKVTCHGLSGQRCAVTEELTIVEHLNKKGKLTTITAVEPAKKKPTPKPKTKTVIVAKRTVSIPAGKTVKVTLTLTGTGRRLLKQRKLLPTRLTAVLTVSGKKKIFSSRNVTIHAPKPKKRPKAA